MTRPLLAALASIAGLVATLGGIALAAPTGLVLVTVVSDRDVPVSGATVTVESSANTYSATSASGGRAVITGIVPNTYTVTVTAAGFAPQRLTGIVIAADQPQAIRFQLRAQTRASRAAPPPPPELTPLDAAVGLAPDGQAISDSVLAIVNDTNPEHAEHGPYFGRYSYVLLRSDADAAEKNRAVLTRLADKYRQNGDPTVAAGAPRDIDLPASYNLFLVLVKNDVETLPAASTKQLVDAMLEHYDYNKARKIRDEYCRAPGHQQWPPCRPPRDAGPLIITFVRPLGGRGPYPPALAYDFSSVPAARIPNVVDDIQKKIVVHNVKSDEMLPPAAVDKYIAPGLTLLADALNASITGVRALLDPGLTKH